MATIVKKVVCAHLRRKVLELAGHGEGLGVGLEADALAGGGGQRTVDSRRDKQRRAIADLLHIAVAAEGLDRIGDDKFLRQVGGMHGEKAVPSDCALDAHEQTAAASSRRWREGGRGAPGPLPSTWKASSLK